MKNQFFSRNETEQSSARNSFLTVQHFLLKFILVLVVFGGMWQNSLAQPPDSIIVWKTSGEPYLGTNDFLFTSDDNFLVTAGYHYISVTNALTGELLRSIQVTSIRRMTKLSSNDSLIYSVGDDPLIYAHRISDLSVYKKYSQMDSVFKHDNGSMKSSSEFFDITKDNKFIAINWENLGLGIYDLEKDSIIYHEQIKESTGASPYFKVKFFQNDSKLAVAYNDGVRIYDTKTFKIDRTIGKATYGKVMDFDITPDETKIITLDIKGETLIWDLQTGEKLYLLPMGYYTKLGLFDNQHLWKQANSTEGIQFWEIIQKKKSQEFPLSFGVYFGWSRSKEFTLIGAGNDPWFMYLIRNNKILSVEGAGENDMKQLFPNPVTNKIIIEFEQKNDSEIFYNISNLTGQIVEQGNFGFRQLGVQFLTIDVSVLPEGMYFLSIISNNDVTTYKFVKWS